MTVEIAIFLRLQRTYSDVCVLSSFILYISEALHKKTSLM